MDRNLTRSLCSVSPERVALLVLSLRHAQTGNRRVMNADS